MPACLSAAGGERSLPAAGRVLPALARGVLAARPTDREGRHPPKREAAMLMGPVRREGCVPAAAPALP